MLAVAAALIVVAVASIATSGHRTANGCIDVKFPIAIGAQELYGCGSQARAICAEVNRPGGTSGVAGAAVAEQCRRARLPVGEGQ